ncbi:tudor domain-containing 6 isoform X1 [Gadus chalcogrammus]|uniref:tudor domain-containing 6 isoform X1 n=1 Tax=Gadus chalcogrammus TaxID=1042646 RepID=UPI0024C2F3AE|nr:tudor domain-containing 6 isoform X1 [Gadus chalcogrammus]XP_056446765.1 tudor domain-containing 6 isoform X1 [Gadus chalcogrammus]
MDLKMFSISEPPTSGSEVVFVVKKVCFKSHFGLVELLVDIGYEVKGVQENKTEEVASDQINPDSKDNPVPECVLTKRQNIMPYQLETCFLANILPFTEKWSEKATIFLKSVLDKQMSGLVEDVLMPDGIILIDIPLIGNFLSRHRMAKKIEAGHFRSLVLSSLDSPTSPSTPCSLSTSLSNGGDVPKQYLYLELQSGFFENVKVTQVTDSMSLFCKLSIFSKEQEKLSKQMQLHYEGRSTLGPARPWASGSPCATRSADGTWQRSQLTQAAVSDTGFVDVLHVDHGETQRIPMSEVRHLHDSFLRIPVFAYHCALDGVDGTTRPKDQIDVLKSLMRGSVVAKFECYDAVKNIYDVRLFGDNAACINAYFIEESIVLSDSRHAGKDSLAEDRTTPSDTDETENSFIPKVGLTDQFFQCSASPKSANPPANRRTDNDKCVDKKCWPDPSPLRKENANSVMQNGSASAQTPDVEKKNICEQILPVGSCVAVKVTFIESPLMFFCQILENRESLLLLMKDLQSYYDTSRVEKPVIDFCVARHPDNHMWYRGRIMDRKSSMTDVRFIDYGHIVQVPLKDLRSIDPRFMCMKAHALQCCLQTPLHPDNPSAAPWTDGATEEFRKFVDEGDFSKGELKCTIKAMTRNPQGFACSVVEIGTPLQSVCDLLTRLSVSQSVHPPEVITVPLVPTGYSHSTHNLEVGSREEVSITCSVSVNHFYCQLTRNNPSFDRIMEGVQQLLASQSQCTGLPLVVDSACIARYTDNKWYRGHIKKTGTQPQVCFVEFGDVVSLKMSDVLPVPAECSAVRSLPVQAVEVGLFDVPADAPKEINDWFEEHAVGHCFTISVEEIDSSGKLLVVLFDGTLNVNLTIKARTVMAKKRNGSHPQPVPSPSSGAERHALEIPVDHCQMQKLTITEPKMRTAQPNEMCGRNGPQAKVEQSGPSVAYALLDTNKPVQPSVAPSNALKNATLADLPPKLIEQRSSFAVHVSHFKNPSRVFVQLQQDEKDIYAIVDKLNDQDGVFSGPVQFDSLNVSDLISAEFPDDSAWYRAVVGKKLDDGSLAVEFIDFGNEATIPCGKTCYLDKEFLAQPRFAIPCQFGEISNEQEQWDQEAISAFKSDTVENPEKTYSCTFMKETRDIWDIVLVDQGVALSQKLIQQPQPGSNSKQTDCTEGTSRYPKPDVLPNCLYQVFATCIVGPHFFWCQHENPEVLDKVTKLTEEAGRLGGQDPAWVGTLSLGSPCLALFPDDNHWYRAQVIRRTGDAISVLFVDYGNETEVDVSGVKAVPRFLFESAPQAFLCALEGFDESKGTWEECASDEFYELLVDKALCVTPLSVGDNLYTAIPQYTVRAEIGETVVNKAMENHWKALGGKDGDISPAQSPPLLLKDKVINSSSLPCY